VNQRAAAKGGIQPASPPHLFPQPEREPRA